MTATVSVSQPHAAKTRGRRDPIPLRIARRAGTEISRRASNATLRRALREAGVPHAPTIPTFTAPSELKVLFDLARSLPAGSSALEVGSYVGASACYLAAGLRQSGGQLFCVDTWQNETMPEGPRDTFTEFEKNTCGIQSMLRIIRKRVDQVTQEDVPDKLELIFIDGDHTYQAAKSDFLHMSPWLSKSGIVVFHDVYYWKGITRIIGEALISGDWVVEGRQDSLLWISRSKFRN